MSARKTAVVIGVGPGLGMSIAHRFGREGFDVALVSRSDARHARYRAELAEACGEAQTFTADVRDRDRLPRVPRTIAGPIDVLYSGPGAADLSAMPVPIDKTGSDAVRQAMAWLWP